MISVPRVQRALLCASLCMLVACAEPAKAQTGGPYDLRWNSFDGGAALNLVGAPYALKGTVGQPDAGRLLGGVYDVQGGFWNFTNHTLDAPEPPSVTPSRFAMFAPTPNPFRARAVITFDLPSEERVRIEAFSVDGRRVRTLLDETRPAGRHQMWWDGNDDVGRAVGQGVYFLRVTAGSSHSVKKLVRAE